ncbi:MAG: DsbC family protein [Burkholderiaceae bacterium]|jgi:thiol:disulfide interchange protein DsbC|nr:DsbC family protein [Burkholderiaceae bacterium]
MTRKFLIAALALLALSLPLIARADEAAIRKNLAVRLPEAFSQIDQITPTPMTGLYEVRVGTDLFYTDAQGDWLIQGDLMDTRAHKNLTEDRLNKLTAIAFKDLPMQNAFTIVRGTGKRQLALFEDPNCGYCKHFEQGLQKISDITVHVFLIPILGQDSTVKARQIWCSADQGKAWQDWMVRGIKPMGSADCDADALQANLDFARKYHITGTPTLVFADGSRVSGALPEQQVEQRLSK